MNSVGRLRFGGALAVAILLKVLAVLTVVGGVITAIVIGSATDDFGSPDSQIVVVATVMAATAVWAGILGCLGYGLEVLVEIYEQLWHIRYGEDEDEEV